MNGGVSLAVWIGGVSDEVNEVVREAGAYGELLRLTGATARVDVITGTSAGGINGALLALAISRGAGLEALRDVWLDKGALTSLLHSPHDEPLTSLLRGNGYFLVELKRAFKDMQGQGTLVPPRQRPIHLVLTATLLEGQRSKITDDLGNVVADVSHRGRFVFVRSDEDGRDDFADARIGERLAMASRATASFPVAFEPLYCPVNADPAPKDARLVDMGGIATFPSGFVLDGGILDNKPLEPAIETIFAQRGDRDVRRVLCYVVPDPGETTGEVAADPGAQPSLGRVALASLVSLPRVESISEQLKAIVEHNRRVRHKRDTRMSVVRTLGVEGVRAVAAEIFPYCRARRRQSSIEYVVDVVARGYPADAGGGVGIGRRRRAWIARVLDEAVTFPWVPETLPGGDARAAGDGGRWHWGLYTVENMVETMQDFLSRISRLMPPDEDASRSLLRHDLFELRRVAGSILAETLALRAWDRAFWGDRGAELPGVLRGEAVTPRLEPVRSWAAAAVAKWLEGPHELRYGAELARLTGRERALAPASQPEAQELLAEAVAAVLAQAVPIARVVLGRAREASRVEERGSAADLKTLADYLSGPAPLDPQRALGADAPLSAATVLRRLLLLEVVLCSVDCDRGVRDQFVELVQISGDTPSPLANCALAKEKLAGLQLAHFGAFYKRSWRANDWMFGRLDGADRLVRVLLNPGRLARLYFGPGAAAVVADAIGAIAVPADLAPSDRTFLEPLWHADRPAVERELAFLEDGALPVPEQLVACAAPVIRRVHLAVLRGELAKVADAVDADIHQGADERSAAAAFRDALRHQSVAAAGWPKVAADTVVELARQCRVGAEKLSEEVGSDLFTKTAAQGAAVATSALADDSAGLGAARPLFATIRLPVLLLDALAQTVVRQSRTAVALLAGLFAASGATVAFALLTHAALPALAVRIAAIAFVAVGALLLRKRPRLVASWLVVCGVVWAFHRWIPTLVDHVVGLLSR
jgi:patatin-related protein